MKKSAVYYVCVVDDRYTGPKHNIGQFMGDYACTPSPKYATIFTEKQTAERAAARLPYLSVIPLTMKW